MSKKFSWDIETDGGIEKVAMYDSSDSGDKLSKDSRLWPQEIIDILINKFKFLSKYKISLKVDKKDKESMSAFLYAIIPLSESITISVPIIVKDSVMKPAFPFIYKNRFYPMIKSSVDDILSGDVSLGSPSEKPKGDYKTPWHFMQKFLQSTMFNKYSSLVSLVEDMDEDSLNVLLKNARIQSLFKSIRLNPERRVRVKTAYVKGNVYTEIFPGKKNRKVYIGDSNSVTSSWFKTAEINEAIAMNEDKTIHIVDGEPSDAKVTITGGSTEGYVKGLVYKINIDGITYDCLRLDSSYNAFYCKGLGFIKIDGYNGKDKKLSDVKVEIPEPKIIDTSMIGKDIMLVKPPEQLSSERNSPSAENPYTYGVLESIIEDGIETKYVFHGIYPRVWIYSKDVRNNLDTSGFESKRIINKKPKGYVVKVIKVDNISKTAEAGEKINLRVESMGDKKYSVDMEDKSGEKQSYIFDPKEEEFVGESNVSEIESTVEKEGDKAEIEHVMLEHGVPKEDIENIMGVADREGSATATVTIEDASPSEGDVSKEEVKMASFAIKNIRDRLPLRKIAGIIKSKEVADIFSLHMLTPKNISAFMDNVDMIDNTIDLLCRYYIYKNLGLNTESDKISIGNIEDVIISLYGIQKDFKKYKVAYESMGE